MDKQTDGPTDRLEEAKSIYLKIPPRQGLTRTAKADLESTVHAGLVDGWAREDSEELDSGTRRQYKTGSYSCSCLEGPPSSPGCDATRGSRASGCSSRHKQAAAAERQ